MQLDSKSTIDPRVLPPQGFTRAKDLTHFLPFSITTLWAWSKAGKFPKPVKLSPTVTAWRNADVLAWLDKQGANHEAV